jgi:plasmid stabilization system protein ParE
MAFEIVRKKRFLTKLTRTLEFLEGEWGINVAYAYLVCIDKKVDNLKKHPYTGAPSGIKSTRSLHITKHSRIFYKVTNSKVIILNLYDTRKKTYRSPVG